MKFFLPPLLAIVLIIGAFPSNLSAQQQVDFCVIAKNALVEASALRGLAVKKKVPCLIHGKDKIKEYLMATIADKLPAGKLKFEGVVFKQLGMIPEDFSYEQGIVDLYLNQIGGYYDPDKDHFIMADWIPALLQSTVAVHELTHGLQDQYFDLGNYINPKIDNSDALLARSAVAEGDANAVMLDQARKRVGQPPISAEKDVESFMLQNVVGMSMMANSLKVPQSLQMMLLFPYTSGLRFVHTLLRQGGFKKVNQAYSLPPRSTEEILHPEKYATKDADFRDFEISELRTSSIPSEAKVVYQDTMGEFGISALLAMYVQDKSVSAKAAVGWGGDRVAVFELGDKHWTVWKSAWDSAQDAEEFFQLFIKSLQLRFSDFTLEAASGAGYRLKTGEKLSLKKEAQLITFSIVP